MIIRSKIKLIRGSLQLEGLARNKFQVFVRSNLNRGDNETTSARANNKNKNIIPVVPFIHPIIVSNIKS